MNRREVIKFLLAATCFTGCSGFFTKQEEAVESTLYRRLDYLKLNRGGVSAFAKDFAIRFPKNATRVSVISFAKIIDSLVPISTPLSAGVLRHEDFILQEFLRSSSFFFDGEDETKEVRYLGYHDPYLRPCLNPFGLPSTQT